MEIVKTYSWDIVNYLKTEDEIAAYLEAALEDGDSALVINVLNDIARAKGIAPTFNEKSENTTENCADFLYLDGNSEFSTVLKFVQLLGLKLRATPI